MLIKKFYETYLDEQEAEVNPNKEELLDMLHGKMNDEELMQAEEILTGLEDSSAETAFYAGFKKAFELLVEVLV